MTHLESLQTNEERVHSSRALHRPSKLKIVDSPELLPKRKPEAYSFIIASIVE